MFEVFMTEMVVVVTEMVMIEPSSVVVMARLLWWKWNMLLVARLLKVMAAVEMRMDKMAAVVLSLVMVLPNDGMPVVGTVVMVHYVTVFIDAWALVVSLLVLEIEVR